MNTHAPIHIFRPGKHTDASGKTLAFSELDLEASAKAYDPALFEAPLVVGHPQLDAPAYGWVASLSFSQSGLAACPRQVDPAFAELVRAGIRKDRTPRPVRNRLGKRKTGYSVPAVTR